MPLPVIALAALLALDPAHAGARYVPAMRTTEVGLAMPVAGAVLGAGMYGLSRQIDDEDRRAALGTATGMLAVSMLAVGPALTAGGSLRAQRALSEEGTTISRTAGWVAWGCYGAIYLSTGTSTGEFSDAERTAVYVAVGTAYAGAYAAGLTQYLLDRRGGVRSTTGAMSAHPWSNGSETGLALTGRW